MTECAPILDQYYGIDIRQDRIFRNKRTPNIRLQRCEPEDASLIPRDDKIHRGIAKITDAVKEHDPFHSKSLPQTSRKIYPSVCRTLTRTQIFLYRRRTGEIVWTVSNSRIASRRDCRQTDLPQ